MKEVIGLVVFLSFGTIVLYLRSNKEDKCHIYCVSFVGVLGCRVRDSELRCDPLWNQRTRSRTRSIPGPETSIANPNLAAELDARSFPETSNVVRDITQTAKNLLNAAQPLTVKLVGINSVFWCRSIHVGLYTEAG